MLAPLQREEGQHTGLKEDGSFLQLLTSTCAASGLSTLLPRKPALIPGDLTSSKGAGSGPVLAALSPTGIRRALSTGCLHPASGTQGWLWVTCALLGWDATTATSTLPHPRGHPRLSPLSFSSTWLEKQNNKTRGRELLRSRRVKASPGGQGGPTHVSGPGGVQHPWGAGLAPSPGERSCREAQARPSPLRLATCRLISCSATPMSI